MPCEGQPTRRRLDVTLPSEPVHNPFAGLSREEFRAVASRIGANPVFVAKLRDRQIDAETMTDGFKRLVSNEVKGTGRRTLYPSCGDARFAR